MVAISNEAFDNGPAAAIMVAQRFFVGILLGFGELYEHLTAASACSVGEICLFFS
jgi:hypothetical protein